MSLLEKMSRTMIKGFDKVIELLKKGGPALDRVDAHDERIALHVSECKNKILRQTEEGNKGLVIKIKHLETKIEFLRAEVISSKKEVKDVKKMLRDLSSYIYKM